VKDHMRETIARLEQIVGGIIATNQGALPALLDTRDIARDEQAWLRSATDGSELALKYRLLMASIEIHASGALANWPDDPQEDPSALKLGQIEALLFKDFRDLLDEGAPPTGH